MYQQFTDDARKVIQFANQEAQRFNHEYLGSEHLLLGMIKEGSGVAATVLRNMDVDLRKIRNEVEKIVAAGPVMVTMGELPQTPRAKKTIENAIEEARNLNHNYVGTEHLLLGLSRVRDSVAVQVLMNLNVNPEKVREEVLNLLGHADTETTSAVGLEHFLPLTFISGSRKSRQSLQEKGYSLDLQALPDDIDYIQHLAGELAQYCERRKSLQVPERPETESEVTRPLALVELEEQLERVGQDLLESVP